MDLILFDSTTLLFSWLISDPWEHVLALGLGAVFGNQLVKWEAKVEEDLDKLLHKAKEANERRYIGTLLSSMLLISVLLIFSFLQP